FDHSILHDFPRNRDIPLPALGWTEVDVSRSEPSVRTYSRNRILQSGANRIQAAADRTISESESATLPAGINILGPGWVVGHIKQVADNLRTAHVPTES